MKTIYKHYFLIRTMLLTTIFLFIAREDSFANTLKVPQDFPSIQTAINSAATGDTILVFPGTYYENINIHKVLTLVSSSGAPNTVIQDLAPSTGWGTPETIVISVDAPGTGTIRGFTIKGNYDTNGAGIKVTADGWKIEQCIFLKQWFGINAYAATATIVDNIFKQNNPLAIGAGRYSKILRNKVFGDNEDGIYARDHAFVGNNLLIKCTWSINCGGSSDSVVIRNNVITTIGSIYESQQYGVYISYSTDPPIIENNIIAYCGRDGIDVSSSNSNVPSGYTIANNDVFMQRNNYSNMSDLTGQKGNISLPPIFCDNDSLFFLASDSPCIDAGLMDVKDVDGSRSDMGIYGGDYAVDVRFAPSSFSLLLPKDQDSIIVIDTPYVPKIFPKITFKWSPSFDRDKGDSVRYRLILGSSFINTYRDLNSPTKLVTNVLDTLYADSVSSTLNLTPYKPGTYYYTVEAIDRTGLFKRANTVNSFIYRRITLGVSQRLTLAPNVLSCSQNFPNPFNGTTHIRYTLPYASRVHIVLYDELGREIRVIEDAFKLQGYYDFTIDAHDLTSGVYYYRFLSHNYTTVKSLVILK